ncbi:hypothetical protein [Streptococcus pluranimalium]|uniref:hypothetical protein n=1 Tax=Streptococcus pluranimalium TaxID=82348 RepID=UPI0039FDA699
MTNDNILDVVNKSINDNFNVDNQLVEFVVAELNQMNLSISQEQAQHIVNIIEYISKSSAKSGAVAAINAINALVESNEQK